VDAFSERLLSEERLLWTGKPSDGLQFTSMDLFLLPFSVVWIGFALVWTFIASRSGAGTFFVLWGMMFVVFGVTVMWGRFWFDAWLRERTRYAITDRRLLISRSGPFSMFTVLALERLPEARLTERGDGSGSIRFGQSNIFAGAGFGLWVPSLDSTPQLIGIPNARDVFDLVQCAAAGR